MSAHIYKKVVPKHREPVSFVAAVKQWGDDWRLAFSPVGGVSLETVTFAQMEACHMRRMERGEEPRIPSRDLDGSA